MFGRRSPAARGVAAAAVSPDELRVAWQVCSLLLEYPSETLRSRLGLLRQAASQLSAPLQEPVCRMLAHLEATPLTTLQRDYVATFDHTRRGCLYLTYFSSGDTRKRGVALVQFKQAFRRAGVEVSADELPDHLAVVLEFGATVDADAAWKLLLDHRASIEVLRLALVEQDSPWSDVVAAVSRTLPSLGPDEGAAVARLIAEGPPTEGVGLEPYAVDPRLNPHPADNPYDNPSADLTNPLAPTGATTR